MAIYFKNVETPRPIIKPAPQTVLSDLQYSHDEAIQACMKRIDRLEELIMELKSEKEETNVRLS